jgi:hypothetical protein
MPNDATFQDVPGAIAIAKRKTDEDDTKPTIMKRRGGMTKPQCNVKVRRH